MTGIANRPEVLDREFLEIRSRLLDLAAALDRIERARGDLAEADARPAQIREGIEALRSENIGRAERVQRIFSLSYSPDWKSDFRLPVRDAQ